MSDTWPDEMPARKRPLPFNSKEAAKLIAKEAMGDGPLGPLDTAILGSKGAVRVAIPLNDYVDARRFLLFLRDAIEPIIANADRLQGERTKLLHVQSELRIINKKINAYTQHGKKRL